MSATEAAVRVIEGWWRTFPTDEPPSDAMDDALFDAAAEHLLRVFKASEPQPPIVPCGIKHPMGWVCHKAKGHPGDHHDVKATAYWHD